MSPNAHGFVHHRTMSLMSRPAPKPPVTSSHWQTDDAGWTLHLLGDWRGTSPLASHVAVAPRMSAQPVRVVIDASLLTHWDAALAASLWQRLLPLHHQQVPLDFSAAPEGLRSVMQLALTAQTPQAGTDFTPDTDAHHLVARVGSSVQRGWADALTTAAFLGEVLVALARWLRLMPGRSSLRAVDLAREIDHCGPKSLPIVTMTCALVGLMLAYMGGAQLGRIGAQNFIADVVTVGMVREMAGLMTGVILAGRLGAAFAAQLASMQANEEIDALRAMGVDPISYLVLPRVLALALVAPLLITLAALVGVLAGLPAAVGVYGVPPSEYINKCLKALTWTHLWIGLFKGTLYAVLVALAGCREGLHAGRNAQAVGVATTAAVVKSLIWIVVAACGTTVFFQSLGF